MAEAVPQDGVPQGEDNNAIKSKELQYVFAPGRVHFPSKPYYEDGDPEMYTTDNMGKREALRENPLVRSAITDFMTSQFPNLGAAKLVPKDDYVRVFIRVGSSLRPGMDQDELTKVIREDFESDSQPRKKRRPQATGDEEEQPEVEEQEEPPKNEGSLTEE